MNINQINNKQIIKGLLIIIVIAVFGLVIHQYLQFRAVKMEELRVEQVREEKKREAEARQKVFDEEIHRCDNAKPIVEIAYKNNLLSVNLDCVDTKYVLKEISKKIGVKIVYRGSLSIDIPTSFNNLTIEEGLNIIGKNTGFSTDYKPSYRSDKNIWSFDEVILEVKDPPQGGVVAIIDTYDSYDFIRADGTIKKRSENLNLYRLEKSENSEYVVALKDYSKNNIEFVVLNNQGEEQWKKKVTFGPDSFFDFVLSNNGKYLVASRRYDGCDVEDCDFTFYIINKDKTSKTPKNLDTDGTSEIRFTKDGNFFIYRNIYNDMYHFFNENGDEVQDQKIIDNVKTELIK